MPFDRKAHWENVYKTKAPREVSWYQREPEVSLRLVANAGLAQEAALLDVGGGASVLVDRLQAQGFGRLAVLDISAQALAHARERLGEKTASVEWFEADVTRFEPPHPFDLWHDRAVFHFLTEATDRAAYVESLKRTLSLQGHLIIAAFAIGGPTQCSGLDIVQYDAPKLQRELGEGFRLVEQVEELHITPADKEQKFAYFRFVREA